MLFWLVMALILLTAPPLLFAWWLQIQHMRKQGPLKTRQIIVLVIVLVLTAFFAVEFIRMSVWTIAATLRR